MTSDAEDLDRVPLLNRTTGSKKNQILAAGSASFGGLSLGTVLSYTSPALSSLEKSAAFSNLTVGELSWFASLAPLASAAGSASVGIFTAKIGRKGTILLLTVPLLIGWILIGITTQLYLLFLGRILTGFASGGYSVVVPIYINETTSKTIRGRLGLLNTVGIPAGQTFVYIAGIFLSYNYLALLMCTVPIIMAIAMLCVSESPRYYLCQGDALKAEHALKWLRGTENVNLELDEMKYGISHPTHNISVWSFLSSRSVLKPMSVCLALLFFLVASGIDALNFFTEQIFDLSSGPHPNSAVSSVFIGLTQVFSMSSSVFLIDRFGRKPLMIISELTMAFSLAVLGTYFNVSRTHPHAADALGWIPLATLILFVFGFGFGMGSVPYIYLEVIPAEVAGLASGIAVSFSWVTGFLETRFFETMVVSFGSDGTFWLFAGICVLGAVYVRLCVPETKGKTLEDIRSLFK